jgi:hypothetical protein
MIDSFQIWLLVVAVKLVSSVKYIENGTFAGNEVNGQWTFNDYPNFHRNYSCIFQSSNFNCWHFDNSSRPDNCSMIRYFPNANFERIDPVFLFSKFNGSKLHFEGDSISGQTFANLACRLQPYLNDYKIEREGKWCNDENLCHQNSKWNTYGSARATFNWDSYNIEISYNSSYVPSRNKMLTHLKPNDVFVFNYGLHLDRFANEKNFNIEYSILIGLISSINALKHAGVHVVWQETIAPLFLTSDKTGLHSKELVEKQKLFEAKCVDVDQINRAAAWQRSTNSLTTPLMIKEGISVLNIWNATLSAPAVCHIGGGRDCVHFCEPGVLNYASDLLLHYLHKL